MLKLLHILGLITVLVSLVGLTTSRWWAFGDLITHFQPQMAVVILVSGIAALSLQRPVFAGLAAIYVLIIAGLVWLPRPKPIAPNGTVDLYFQNMLVVNNNEEAFESQVIDELAPTVAIVETNPTSRRVLDKYYGRPVVSHENQDDVQVGLGCSIHSVLPSGEAGVLTADPEVNMLNDDLPTPLRELTPPYPICYAQLKDYTLLVLHPAPPISPQKFRLQKEYFEVTTAVIEHLESARPNAPLVIVGDFNSTRYSGLFRKHFGDRFQGHRYTWRLNNWTWQPLHLPIDHALAKVPIKTKLAPDIGSDHRGLLISIDTDAHEKQTKKRPNQNETSPENPSVSIINASDLAS